MSMSKLMPDRNHRAAVAMLRKVPDSEIEDLYSNRCLVLLDSFIGQYMSDGDSYDQARSFAQSELMAIRSLRLKKYHNLYINNSSLVEFLEASKIKESDLSKAYEIAIQTVQEFRDYGVVVNLQGKENSILLNFSPADQLIHPETRQFHKGTSVFYKIFPKNESADVGFIPLSQDYGVYYADRKINAKENLNDWMVQFFLNLCAYMSAFPECVVQGPPLEKTRSSDKRSTIVKISDSLRDVYRDGVSPHMRRGHFRFLKSDRYTNKRFQAVYVRPTMVKGSATTVVSS